MKVFYGKTCKLLLVFLFGCFWLDGICQTDTSAQQTAADSIRINAVKERLRQKFKDSISYESDTVVALLLKKIEAVTELINTANRLSEKGFDTVEIAEKLPETEQLLGIISANYVSKEPNQNLRSLKTAKGILLQVDEQLENWQNMLFKYSDQLAEMKTRLAEIARDSSLRKLPKDSLLRDLYFGQLATLAVRWKQTDSINNRNLFGIGIMQTRVAASFMRSKDLIDKTNDKINKYIQDLWHPEEPSLLTMSKDSYFQSFFMVLNDSWQAFMNMVLYYIVLNVNVWLTAIIGLGILYGWFIWLKRKIIRSHNTPDEIAKNANLISKKPFLVAVGLILVFILFFYFNLPPAWTTTIWCALSIVFFFLNRSKTKKNNSFKIEFLVLFIVANFLGLLLKSSFAERWLWLLLNIGMIAFGVNMIRNINKGLIHYAFFARNVYLVFTLFSFAALVANLTGNFMLSKTFDNGAVYAVLTAHVLFITAEILVQLIYLQQEAYKENKFASYFDFINIQQTMSKSLKMAAIIGWVVVMAQQLNFFDYAYELVVNFLNKDRTLGDNVFDFGSILVFIMVIWLSSFISKLMFVFFGDSKADGKNKKSKWSSFLILIRLGILSAGILIAFAASGIPIDKLTIIIGALGVGIGFGLQNIVNNLVSGVILAFERPVQIGDAIEVGNRYGVIKEIGIRSSKIVTVEGSEVIVPNGDMLSQHIVNWTLSSHYRRVELIVGVAYSTKLREAESILQQIINTQEGIQKKPAPLVLAHQFGDSSIDFRLLFWCDIDAWIAVKSEVLIKVHQAFGEHGIEIPFPQRDINIKNADVLLDKEVHKEEEEQ